MGKCKAHKQVSEFSLEGRFLSFVMEDGYKLKHIQVLTSSGEQVVKLSKEARASVVAQGLHLKPGDWIRVEGERKAEDDLEKLKAYRISAATILQEIPGEAPATSATPTKKSTVLVCQKCAKRGGSSVCKALEETLDDRGLTESVSIKMTGCMKDCKAGPHLVFMPGKTRYSEVRPKDVTEIVDRHFPIAVP
ncbi:MAG: (2Fe-2S) ferredoxin domain-containing protein [Leptolyngbyaceae cyanobacterium bins.59]|nr:(2Fe-2S) ferredoxin domain-containing protein [Leptolyngbyaceae cyanobacterium bins.59]